jgi:protoheme IX farnesyltransferase
MNVQAQAQPIPAKARPSHAVGLYLETAKARLSAMVVLTTVVGYLVAAAGRVEPLVLLGAVVGTTLSAFGANILNQFLEAERDARMERTRNRPLPSGAVQPVRALRWGLLSALAGVTVLAVATHPLPTVLALAVILLYVLVYTPAKVHTPFNTAIGAVCGAIPPMIGWSAATGDLAAGAWILFAILFLWQIPHFLALAWLYREDYARGGFRMLPVVDPSGRLTGWLALLVALTLLPVSGAAYLEGMSGAAFLVGSLALGLGFAALAARLARRRSTAAARQLFLASLVYLPLVLGLMVVNGQPRTQAQSAATQVAVASDSDGGA